MTGRRRWLQIPQNKTQKVKLALCFVLERKKNRLGLNEPPIERELRLENAKREGQCHFGIIESPSPVGRKTKQAREIVKPIRRVFIKTS